VGASLFAASVALARNAQIEGLVFGVLTGVVVGPVTHYLLGKLAVPLAAGRVWCGWACWTAALLDQLPYDRGITWPAGPRRPWRTAHLVAVVVGVAVLVLAFGYDRGAVGAHAVVWFVVGNLIYWTWAVALAVRHRDNRAFCKLACPVAVILRTTSRPALLKIAGDPEACQACASRACNAVCPMGVDVAETVLAGARVGGGECIACQQCLAVCPPNALAPSLRFDVAGPERLVAR
jgi:polyferredoxin